MAVMTDVISSQCFLVFKATWPSSLLPWSLCRFRTDVAAVQEHALFCNSYRVSVQVFNFRDSTVQASLFDARLYKLDQARFKPHM